MGAMLRLGRRCLHAGVQFDSVIVSPLCADQRIVLGVFGESATAESPKGESRCAGDTSSTYARCSVSAQLASLRTQQIGVSPFDPALTRQLLWQATSSEHAWHRHTSVAFRKLAWNPLLRSWITDG